MENELNVLSIDAWRYDGSWSWNQWFKIGTIEKTEFESLKSNRQIIKWFRDNGFISNYSKGLITVEDDQYNLVIMDRKTFEPIVAIEYGPAYN